MPQNAAEIGVSCDLIDTQGLVQVHTILVRMDERINVNINKKETKHGKALLQNQ